MTKRRAYMVIVIMILIPLLPLICGAASQNPVSEKEGGKWISNGRELGPWWILNSKLYAPLPSPLLYHFDASYGYSELHGNVKGESHNFKANLVLRKNVFTSTTDFSYIKQDTQVAGARTLIEKQDLSEFISFDILKFMSLEGGYKTYFDTTKYYDDSYSYFGGVAFTGAPFKQRLIFKAGGYYGKGQVNFENGQLADLYLYVPAYESDFLFFSELLIWNITKKISLIEYGDYLYCFDDYEPNSLVYNGIKYQYPTTTTRKPYRWTLNLTLNIKITAMISVFGSYKITHDENPVSDALSSTYDFIDDHDTTFTTGFTISL